jgi:hypothetical protein
LQTGAWIANGISASPGFGARMIPPKEDRFFSPESIAGQSVR